VINTNLAPILHCFRDIAVDRSKIAIFGYPSCVQPPQWEGSPGNIIISDISVKTNALGYISVGESLGIFSATFRQCDQQATEFSEITQNKLRAITPFKVIQGHPFLYQSKVHNMNFRLVPKYNFLLVINTNLPLSLHRLRDIAFDKSKIAIFGYSSCI